jgi:hypothetical protein
MRERKGAWIIIILESKERERERERAREVKRGNERKGTV